jgi:hypothetical protein
MRRRSRFFAWSQLRQLRSPARLALEVVLSALATNIGWAAVWANYWWIEQRT